MMFRKRHAAEANAERIANVIRQQLTRLNLAYRAKADGVEYIQQVDFVEPLIATPSEIKLEVDISRLPRGVHVSDLKDSKLLETLGAACRHPVRAEQIRGHGGGFWFVVELEERSKIPSLFRWDDLMLPQRAPALMIPFGVGENGKQRWEDLRTLPHLLIAGATGQGKSVLVNAILCYLVARLTPQQLRLVLVDLKGGVELSPYEGLPHVDCLITKRHELPGKLLELQAEMDRRTEIMRGSARDIDEHNKKLPPSKRLPYIVAVIDEIANAMLSKDKIRIEMGDEQRKGTVSSETQSLLADLAARARATGIHLIVSTQRPSVDVITGLIKANFPCRVAFGTASDVDSRVIIDDPRAAGLNRGRMQFRRNMDLIELQAPLIDTQAVMTWIERIKAGDKPQLSQSDELAKRNVHILMIAKVSRDDFGGSVPIVKLAKHPAIQSLSIGRNKVAAYVAELAQLGAVTRGWFRSVYKLKWSNERFQREFGIVNLTGDRRPATELDISH